MWGTRISLCCFFLSLSSILAELKFWVFDVWREENRRTWRKTLGAGTRTNNKLNLHMILGRNRTQVTLAVGERSHHCAIPALQQVTVKVPCTQDHMHALSLFFELRTEVLLEGLLQIFALRLARKQYLTFDSSELFPSNSEQNNDQDNWYSGHHYNDSTSRLTR